MGFAIAWVATKTADRGMLCDLAQVAPTAEQDEFFESPITGVELNGGWFLLVGQGCNHRIIAPDLLASLANLGDCVACSVEEHVMFSSSELWRRGTQVWAVSHDAQQGIFDLSVSGSVPPELDPIRAEALRTQEAEGGTEAEVDYIFDVPLLLAKHLTGFKHDEVPKCLAEPQPRAFTDLGGQGGSKPWWKFW